MRAFRYLRPEKLDEAVALLAEHGPEAWLLAGGTDVIVRLRQGHTPRYVIDLKRARGLTSDIRENHSGLRIGALAPMTEIIADPRVRRYFLGLVESANVVGSVQIRNRATLAGNICNASPAADTAPALLVYGAIANLIGPEGSRSVAVADFFTGPGRTVLRHGELVESIDLPLPEGRTGAAFGRATRRRGVDLATVNLCCRVSASGEVVYGCGAVAPRPFLVRATRQALEAEGFERLAAAAQPISDVRGSRDYRLAMLKVLGRRALETALDRMSHG